MLGDLGDITSRLMAVLPKRWFGEQSPNLLALLQSIATPWVWIYSQLSYAMQQTRIRTATDTWLDMISFDYLGNSLPRNTGESDSNFRLRILAALLRDAATRSAVQSVIAALVGQAPAIFEPGKCLDTGGYGGTSADGTLQGGGFAYLSAGGWGSLELPSQFFITVTRPPSPGVATIAGYGTSPGAYGVGAISYVNLESLPGYVTDDTIQKVLCSLLPINTVGWLRII